ncbi:MAG TPA: hypothetical protein VNN62_11750 [Methylomirabilota bacterium]|nr:hypothetical protein [Methylomirabilota bacterium]
MPTWWPTLEDGRRVQRTDGSRWITVKGQVSCEDGICTNAMPGRVLRRG